MQETKNKKEKKTVFSGGAYALLPKITKTARSIRRQIEQKILPVASTDPAKLREYSRLAVYAVFGFFASIATLPQNIRPFGLSAISAFSEKKAVLCVYIGASVGCITYGRESLSSFIIYFMLYIMRKTFTESNFSEKLRTKMLESAGASMAVGIIRICSGRESPFYAYVAFLTLATVSLSFTYFFGVLFTPEEFSSAKVSTVSICTYALTAVIVRSLDGFRIFGLDLAIVSACVITLSYAVVNGFLHAGIAGFVCGIACGSASMSASLGICGIVSAVLLTKSVVASVTSFALAFFAVCAYSSGIHITAYLLPSVVAGCVAFFPVCGLLPEAFRLSSKNARCGDKNVRKASDSHRRKKLSDAFFSVSDVFSRLAESQKHPSFADVELVVDRTFSSVCAGCALCEMCYAKKKTDIAELKQSFFAILAVRPLESADFGVNMGDKCIRLDRMCRTANESYRDVSAVRSQDNRTALLGSQYAGMARLIADTSKISENELARDTYLEKSIASALSEAEIPFSSVTVTDSRRKKTRVCGINLDRIPFGSSEIKRYILAKCGIKITEPCFDISERNDYVMTFEKATSLRMEYAQSVKCRDGEEVNGDTVNFLDSGDGYFRAYICDGMGSGREAAVSSRLASVFLEKMLDTDTAKGVVLELLNNALLSRSGESFSTVDLFEADLLTGRCVFIKAGAAPTYILRSGKLYKIYSATPPVGIISSFTAESTRFDTEPDDVIIMMSDGIVQNNEDSAWLAELIRFDVTRDPATLAGQIIEKACELCDRSDDMSVCVIKVKKETASR